MWVSSPWRSWTAPPTTQAPPPCWPDGHTGVRWGCRGPPSADHFQVSQHLREPEPPVGSRCPLGVSWSACRRGGKTAWLSSHAKHLKHKGGKLFICYFILLLLFFFFFFFLFFGGGGIFLIYCHDIHVGVVHGNKIGATLLILRAILKFGGVNSPQPGVFPYAEYNHVLRHTHTNEFWNNPYVFFPQP